MASDDSWKGMKDGTGCQAPESHRLCANGCGFFGTAANRNLCSKCYRDLRIKEEQAASAKVAVEKSLSSLASASLIGEQGGPLPSIRAPATEIDAVAVEKGEEMGLKTEKQRNRCASCKRRVGLTGFNCRCGSTFCGAHRYPEEHRCSFDFKAAGREEIARANPVVKADKLRRI